MAVTSELAPKELAGLVGVDATYIWRWRKGLLPQRVGPGIRKRLIAVVERLERGSKEGQVDTSARASYDAGYAAAMFDYIAKDAQQIMERALEAKARMEQAPKAPGASYSIASAEPSPVQVPSISDPDKASAHLGSMFRGLGETAQQIRGQAKKKGKA